MLKVNSKKPLTLRNTTNYFVPDKDKVRNTFASPSSYRSRQMKIEGYETRLYWQYKYCKDKGGQTFFYTLTYNDLALPRYKVLNGEFISCFDYEHLRHLLTGGFRKQLLRKFGSTFKYFIGAELGDGKGERGMHNNPHYHILLFLEPASDVNYPYSLISEVDMTHLMRLYWQGFDEDVSGYRDYNTALYGIVKEGKYGAVVKDFRALCYCAKYVTKDVKLVQAEDKIEKYNRFKIRSEYRYKEEVYKAFFDAEIKPRFNTPLNSKKTKWSFSDVELIKMLVPEAYELYQNQELFLYQPYVVSIIEKEGLFQSFNNFLNQYIEPIVKDKINEWRNRFSNKCRISKGVGEYAEKFIDDKLNPLIQLPSKCGFKYRNISLYYYRHMYCDVVKDSKGNNLYVLNELGQQYKLATLSSRIDKLASSVSSYIPLLKDDPDLFSKMKDSDVNTDVFFIHRQFVSLVDRLLSDCSILDILTRYAQYKLVYKDRFFTYQIDGNTGSKSFPVISVYDDYRRFLVPSFYSVPRNDLRLSAFLEDIPENYLPYSDHPYFHRFIGIFSVFDLCADYFFIKDDDKRQKEAEDIASVKRFHSKRELKDFYRPFFH